MTITEYENLNGEPMILIIDKKNDKGESMSKAEYERRQAEAEHFTPMIPGDE
jgi:hypothetical protein